MDTLENILEERLAWLERGEPLDVCLADLSEADALLVKKAATLRSIASAAPISNKLADQRQELLKFAKENRKMSSKPAVANKSRPRWLFPVALAGSAFAVFTCVIIFALVASLTGRGLRSLNLPGGVAFKAADPQSAVLENLQGLVEVQDESGAWKIAQPGQTVQAGEHIRTGALSSVVLGFYDDSQARLGPNTEVSIDQLDAKKTGPRVVVLTQVLGESDHAVAKSSDAASRYEVHTPSGVGTAKGTAFHVSVAATQLVQFDVDEGAVEITNLDTTVVVVAGQSTVIAFGQTPRQPVFRMNGEGQVQQTGSVWHIAGRTFRTDSDTVFIGTIEVGDLVAFSARIVTDGSPILDRVVLISHAPENRFAFTGPVDSMGSDEWTIAGRAVQVDETTAIDGDILVDDIVQVRGEISEDGELLATDIHLIEENEEGLPFAFVGVIDEINDSEWTISGITVTVDDHTNIENGLLVGDVVQVRGRILDEAWLARSIEGAEEDEREFTITGSVESRDPWSVAGVEFDTDERTEIEEGIDVGDSVRVEGRILEDGDWVAEEIELIEEAEPRRFNFTGLVNSIDPWNVGGIDLTTDDQTVIEGQIVAGDLVRARGMILPDGTLRAEKIKLLDNDLGCVNFSTAVREANVNQIVLMDWHVVNLDDEIEVEGTLNIAAVIIISGCTDEDGGFSITHIIVIYQLNSLPVIIRNPSDGHGGEEDEDEHEDDE